MKKLATSFILLGREGVFMKKFLPVIFAIAFTLPAFASCSLDANKPCTATVLDDSSSSLRNKLVPTPLDDLKKTDAFQPKFITPYQEMLINTEPASDYNSNCQFGVCLPERNPTSDITE